MIEESVLENERSGQFRRLFPSEKYSSYKKLFDADRPNNSVLYNYIFNNKYKKESIILSAQNSV
jgi:hypothetical protein